MTRTAWKISGLACLSTLLVYFLWVDPHWGSRTLLPASIEGGKKQRPHGPGQALEVSETPKETPPGDPFEQWCERGKKAEESGNLGEAMRCYGWALTYRKDERIERHWHELDERSKHPGRYDERLLSESSGRSEEPHAKALERYERLALLKKDDKEIQTKLDFHRQIVMAEKKMEGVERKVDGLLEKGMWPEAIAEYDRFFETLPHSPGLHSATPWAKAKNRREILSKIWGHVSVFVSEERYAQAISLLEALRTSVPMGGLVARLRKEILSEMVFVPSGAFRMGNDLFPDERPIHAVTLPSFYIDRHEVTRGRYFLFAQQTGEAEESLPSQEEKELPVVQVSWTQATRYAAWIGKRLPTEAEWEKAARGTDARLYPWGDEFDVKFCNSLEGGHKKSKIVGSVPRGNSPYGCSDMAGNVMEWTSDTYRSYPGKEPPFVRSGYKVARGGSWYYGKDALRCSNRYPLLESTRLVSLGFRCAMDE